MTNDQVFKHIVAYNFCNINDGVSSHVWEGTWNKNAW